MGQMRTASAPGGKKLEDLSQAASSCARVTALNALQHKASSGIAQRTLNGVTPQVWANEKSSKKLVRDRLLEIAQAAHQDDVIYDKAEINAYFLEALKGKTHTELEDTAGHFEAFRRFIARGRDAEGAHGAERHGGSGDKYIVDRVNASRQADFTASYLTMDDWLTWDTVLRVAKDEIWSTYASLSENSLDHFARELPIAGLAQGNKILKDKENFPRQSKADTVTLGNTDWTLTVRSYLPQRAVGPSSDPDTYSVKVGASVKGNQKLNSRTVSKVGGTNVHTHEVRSQKKIPEAHTGGLAPMYDLDADAQVVSAPENGADALNWVTKF